MFLDLRPSAQVEGEMTNEALAYLRELDKQQRGGLTARQRLLSVMLIKLCRLLDVETDASKASSVSRRIGIVMEDLRPAVSGEHVPAAPASGRSRPSGEVRVADLSARIADKRRSQA